MMTRALVQLGHAAAATDFVRWYAGYQFSSGKVPCCVDTRGPDAEPENDSPGELIHAIAELYRFTGDLALLRELWPHVSAGIGYLDALSASEREPVNRAADRTALSPNRCIPTGMTSGRCAGTRTRSNWRRPWVTPRARVRWRNRATGFTATWSDRSA